ARYPYGRMDVRSLTEASIAGFGADGPAVLARARAIRADAVGRSGLRAPWVLALTATPAAAGRVTATVRLTAGAAPVSGITVSIAASGVDGPAAAMLTTGADGVASATFVATGGRYRLTATARVPDLVPQAFAPTAARAQRVVRAATVD